MTIIAITGVPGQCKLKEVITSVAKVIKGQFEALNFANCRGHFKSAYLRLAKSLDPLAVVTLINKSDVRVRKYRVKAQIPDYVPDLGTKTTKIPVALQKKLRLAPIVSPNKVVIETHSQLMTEMRCKYTGIYNLKTKVSNKLLLDIAKVVADRLKNIIQGNLEVVQSYYKLSKAYRKAHPHFGDFQMILSTLHRVEDSLNEPRTQIQEHEFAKPEPTLKVMGKVSFDKMQEINLKYANRIIPKLEAHIANLPIDPQPSPEQQPVVRVRTSLKKLLPYIDPLVRQILSSDFESEAQTMPSVVRMRIYGEPYLPQKETLAPQLTRLGATKINRSIFTANMVRFNVPQAKYTAAIALDGTLVGGAKLVVRSSDVPVFLTPPSYLADVLALVSDDHKQPSTSEEQPTADPNNPDAWTEEW